MVKNRIAPNFICGVVLEHEYQKNELIKILRENNLITVNEKGKEFIVGIPVDKFIHKLDDLYDSSIWEKNQD